jgi:osmotically-inducible protein OsmY
MKTPTLLVVALLCAVPVGSFAAPTDRQIEEAARSSYNFRKVLDRNVEIKVHKGVATLSGTVPSVEQRRIAEDTVAGLEGVPRVDNQLRVEGGAREGSDEWIALKVRSRLAVRPNVSMTNTNVTVKDGVVLLTGTAESMAQKELTEAYAKDIAGVRSVENKLQVVTPADRVRLENGNVAAERSGVTTTPRAARENRETLGEKIDDGSITAQIKYELFAHHSTSGLKTKVETNNGRVTLTGEAQSDTERDLVTRLAKSVRGVLAVDNKMTVKNP